MTMEQVERWYVTSTLPNRVDRLICWDKKSDQSVGCVTLWINCMFFAEIAYWVVPAFQRQGLGSEIVRRVADYTLTELGLKSLYATTSLDNLASVKILRNANFEFHGPTYVKMRDESLRKSFLFLRKALKAL